MSLVNDMLRDLEQRNERTTAVPGEQASVKAAQQVEREPSSSVSRIILWVIGVTALLMTAWLLWQEQQSKSDTTVVVVPEKTVPENVAIKIPVAEPKQEKPLQQAIGETEQPVQANVSGAQKVAKTQVAEVLPEPTVINEIRWAGTEQGGDLVVRLNQDADIQILSQSDKQIRVALENVQLRAALPFIGSDYVKRLDVSRQDQRVLLSLTTKPNSQFSFRVQQQPTTLILGVLPQPELGNTAAIAALATVASGVELVTEEDPAPTAAEDVEPAESEQILKPAAIKSAQELQVHSEVTEKPAQPRKPVTKGKQGSSDRTVAANARQLINRGQLGKAREMLETHINVKPDAAQNSRVLLATLLMSIGDTKAEQLIAESRVLTPDDVALNKLQARLWISQLKPQQAQALLQRAAPTVAQDTEYYELLATTYQQMQQPQQAARIYYQLLELNSGVPRWWIGMGYSLEQSQRYSEARNAYQSALQIPAIGASLKKYAQQRVAALQGR